MSIHGDIIHSDEIQKWMLHEPNVDKSFYR